MIQSTFGRASDNNNSSVEIVSEKDGQLLGSYTIYIGGDVLVAPGPVDPSIGVGEDTKGRDAIGMSIFIGAICEAAGISCDVGLIKNGLAVVLSVGMAMLPIIYTKGRASTGAIGLAVVFFLFGTIIATLLVGFPLWLLGVMLFGLFLLCGLAVYVRLSGLKT